MSRRKYAPSLSVQLYLDDDTYVREWSAPADAQSSATALVRELVHEAVTARREQRRWAIEQLEPIHKPVADSGPNGSGFRLDEYQEAARRLLE